MPEYYDDVSSLPADMPEDLEAHIKSLDADERKQIWISCEDEQNGTAMQYPWGRGLPSHYFPYTNQEGYVSPLVAVQVEPPQRILSAYFVHNNPLPYPDATRSSEALGARTRTRSGSAALGLPHSLIRIYVSHSNFEHRSRAALSRLGQERHVQEELQRAVRTHLPRFSCTPRGYRWAGGSMMLKAGDAGFFQSKAACCFKESIIDYSISRIPAASSRRAASGAMGADGQPNGALSFNRRPPQRPLAQKIRYFFWNPEEGTFLGRTPKRWGKNFLTV
ncbi:hypothetical protein EVAR_52268_1 [Eumeta japonica]|uniref:Uncharacterized protein n=1 Tax=Eumeta variegata TaxID=151549 RepID=A0A4C1YU29_EUMVA|nr:hypothetical protein EVAR_52268_1 [Eumeta japonica]